MLSFLQPFGVEKFWNSGKKPVYGPGRAEVLKLGTYEHTYYNFASHYHDLT